jgi:serine/threonine protein kinase
MLKEFITKITVYTTKEDKIISVDSDISKFVEFLHLQKDKLAKIFKPGSLFSKSIEQKFKDELEMNKQILSIYKSKSSKYLTINPLKGGILGIKIESKKRSNLFAIFGTKCNNTYELHLPNFLIDLLESIVILNNNNYFHNDIKDYNIVLCNNRYKLIDWGGSSTMHIKNSPLTTLTTSIIRWYCYGYSQWACLNIIPFLLKQKKYNAYTSNIFQEVYSTILEEFKEVMKSGLSRDALFEKYKYSFDVFQLGMSLLYLIYDKPTYHKKYIPIIKYLTSLIDPPMNAKTALKHIKSVLN